LERRRQRLEAQGQMLASLSYHSVVGRGFALIRDTSGRAVRSAAALDVGASIDIELADGHVGAIVSDRDPVVRESSTSEEATARHRPPADLRIRPSPRRRSSDRGAGGQGSLF
jgi:exodeoxyribonuclease VII large subunit